MLKEQSAIIKTAPSQRRTPPEKVITYIFWVKYRLPEATGNQPRRRDTNVRSVGGLQMCWYTDWERRKDEREEENLRHRNPPTPPTLPTAGHDEEPEELAEPTPTGQGILFDLEQPQCPHCGALLDEASMQTGSDECFDPTSVELVKDEELLDDQTEFPFD
ncbi:MAG: hypothetical protein BWY53_00554 [Parcubacteria group bacterium ADurb.Bin326]|nr:MAG: hypothetical protein BWY53_00554 [Parcubacteria group bacterium ADurb.Bin326]